MAEGFSLDKLIGMIPNWGGPKSNQKPPKSKAKEIFKKTVSSETPKADAKALKGKKLQDKFGKVSKTVSEKVAVFKQKIGQAKPAMEIPQQAKNMVSSLRTFFSKNEAAPISFERKDSAQVLPKEPLVPDEVKSTFKGFDLIVASRKEAAKRVEETGPHSGMICFDPEKKEVFFTSRVMRPDGLFTEQKKVLKREDLGTLIGLFKMRDGGEKLLTSDPVGVQPLISKGAAEERLLGKAGDSFILFWDPDLKNLSYMVKEKGEIATHPIDSPESARFLQGEKVFKELLETERDFLKDATFLQTFWTKFSDQNPNDKFGQNALTASKNLYSAVEEFQRTLEKIDKERIEGSIPSDLEALYLSENYKKYVGACGEMGALLNVFNRSSFDKMKTSDLVKTINPKADQNFLASSMMKPVQRPPRHALFIQELNKRGMLGGALESVKKLLEVMNTSV